MCSLLVMRGRQRQAKIQRQASGYWTRDSDLLILYVRVCPLEFREYEVFGFRVKPICILYFINLRDRQVGGKNGGWMREHEQVQKKRKARANDGQRQGEPIDGGDSTRIVPSEPLRRSLPSTPGRTTGQGRLLWGGAVSQVEMRRLHDKQPTRYSQQPREKWRRRPSEISGHA